MLLGLCVMDLDLGRWDGLESWSTSKETLQQALLPSSRVLLPRLVSFTTFQLGSTTFVIAGIWTLISLMIPVPMEALSSGERAT
jgi:hypothetical protein